MSWGDVRGLLQYVPQFTGKVFVVSIDCPTSMLVEAMLDLLSLQNIGVKLVVVSTEHAKSVLLDRAAEVELKFCNTVLTKESSVEDFSASLNRGQAVILDFYDEEILSPSLIKLAESVLARKLILLQSGSQPLSVGAIRASDIDAKSDLLLRSAVSACEIGVPRVHILDGSVPGVMLSELFSNEGVGTMVYADSYRLIRPIREEDIVELLGMIGRSVRNEYLVPRYYVDIEKNMNDYYVMEIDGNVVGSVALYKYEKSPMAEIACLYVKENHEKLGYGYELVEHAQQQAQEQDVKEVFSLTTRIAGFFQNKLGYKEVPLKSIPSQRYEQLVESGRESRAFHLRF